MDRRQFLKIGATTAVGATVPSAAAAASPSFRFIHFTDPHIEPELRAGEGTLKCFERINNIKHDFSLAGGDLVFDACEVTPDRAKQLFDLYAKVRKELHKPVYTVPGNHDVYGLSAKSLIPPADPQYGKKMFEDRVGRRYSSFDHKGWHFILLDSVIMTPERGYAGGLDEEQMSWLTDDLKKTGSSVPMVILTHIPIVTAFGLFSGAGVAPGLQFANPKPLLDLLGQYKVKAVLQGHTHVRERVDYKGCQFITSGAVSGNWWKGARLGHPEGFGVLSVNGENIEWQYETYGWVASPA